VSGGGERERSFEVLACLAAAEMKEGRGQVHIIFFSSSSFGFYDGRGRWTLGLLD